MSGPLVLFYTTFFGRPPNGAGFPPRTEWTMDRSRLKEADLVVFHLPNYQTRRLPWKHRGQRFVAWSMESAINYPAMDDRAFMAQFEIEMTYRQSAQVWVTYLPKLAEWEAARAAPVPEKTEPAPLAMFVSARSPHSDRLTYAAQLMRHMRVDSYGRLLHTRDLNIPDTGSQALRATLGRYRFAFAFENSVTADYVTEKFFGPLLVGTVPVYLGAPNIADFAPEGSFVDVTRFRGPKELAQYLNHLAATPSEYARYFEWRQRPLPQGLMARLERVASPTFTRLMEVAARTKSRPTRLLEHLAARLRR